MLGKIYEKVINGVLLENYGVYTTGRQTSWCPVTLSILNERMEFLVKNEVTSVI